MVANLRATLQTTRRQLVRRRSAYMATLRRHEQTLVAQIDAVRREIAVLTGPTAPITPAAPAAPDEAARDAPPSAASVKSATPRFPDTGRPELINPYATTRGPTPQPTGVPR